MNRECDGEYGCVVGVIARMVDAPTEASRLVT